MTALHRECSTCGSATPNAFRSREVQDMGNFADQLRQVLRRLGHAPLFTAITLITLAAGVGANTVIFSVLEGVLLKPLPSPHSEQLLGIGLTAPGINIKDLTLS